LHLSLCHSMLFLVDKYGKLDTLLIMGHVKRAGVLLVGMCALGIALTLDDVTHNNRELFYVNPVAGEIRLKTKKNTVKQAFLIRDTLTARMDIAYQDDYFDYFAADIGAFDTTLAYYFVVKAGADSLVFPPAPGAFRPQVPVFAPPAWAASKIYYLIFIDGFRNGDLVHEPPGMKPWGNKPQDWASYGGDLSGVKDQLDYLDSLGIDILLLSPVWAANSNHKFNFLDFGSVDPAFGDTAALRSLVVEAHRRNKKVVLIFIAGHTGSEFPAFTDILRAQDSSRYVNWYQVKTRPVKVSSACYECWRGDPHFPKLNLKDQQVRNYLLGYVEYWRQFGIDGFYIGEDPLINTDFLKELRAFIKAKYPGLLLVGADSRPITGDGFDGSLKPALTELILNYFGRKTIPVSQFDQALHRILFWMPSQANAFSLITASTYDYRIRQFVGADDIKNMYAFMMTFCGSPVITYGDEIGMAEAESLNLGSFISNPARQDLGLLSEIKRLIRIRKASGQIAGKYFYTLLANDITQVYAYDRGGLITVLNSGDAAAFVMLPAWDGTYTDLLNGEKITVYQQLLKVPVAPKSYRILRREL
jgi:cyclomaltodextrinase